MEPAVRQTSNAILAVKESVRDRDNNRCVECGMSARTHLRKFGRKLDVHRIVPGSVYTVDGCVTLCRPCHHPKPKKRVYGYSEDGDTTNVVAMAVLLNVCRQRVIQLIQSGEIPAEKVGSQYLISREFAEGYAKKRLSVK